MSQTRFGVRLLDGTPQSVGVGRGLLLASLLTQRSGHVNAPIAPDRLFDVRLVTSELLTNAVSHAGGPILLAWAWAEEAVFIAVFDGRGDLPPRVREAGAEATGAVASPWFSSCRSHGAGARPLAANAAGLRLSCATKFNQPKRPKMRYPMRRSRRTSDTSVARRSTRKGKLSA
jgi:hypothetical protein